MKTTLFTILLFTIFSTIITAQWVQTSGPEGGAVPALFLDGSNLFAGTYGGGIFRSTDGGTSWTQKINGIGYQSTTVINKSGSEK